MDECEMIKRRRGYESAITFIEKFCDCDADKMDYYFACTYTELLSETKDIIDKEIARINA